MPQKEVTADEDSQQKKIAKHDASNAADLEKVTDFHEEQELSGGDLETALKAITEKRHKEAQVTTKGERFLLQDSRRVAPNRIIVYATDANLNLLKGSDEWFLDGTFKVCPTIFKQLYSIHKKIEHLKKLAAVKINKEDVELMMRELEIPKFKAETCLRQANGDVVQALLDLIDN